MKLKDLFLLMCCSVNLTAHGQYLGAAEPIRSLNEFYSNRPLAAPVQQPREIIEKPVSVFGWSKDATEQLIGERKYKAKICREGLGTRPKNKGGVNLSMNWCLS